MPIATENKASLTPLAPDGSSAGDAIVVQYNPEKYATSWSITWQTVGNTLQWTKSNPGNLVLTLYFDSYEQNTDVTNLSGAFRAQLDPGETNGQVVGCLFQWGKKTYQGVVASISEEFTLFLADGTPVRSTMTLTLNPWPEAT